MPREDAPCFTARISHHRRAESGCSSVFLHHLPAPNPSKQLEFPFASGGRAGSCAGFSTQMATLMQTSPALAKHERGTQRWAPTQTAAGVSPLDEDQHPCPYRLNELLDFRLNEQVTGMMTKPLYCKKWPKFMILWPNVAPSGINANTPCIVFL